MITLCVCLCVFKVPRKYPVLWMRSQVTLFCHSSPARWTRTLSSSGRKIIKKSRISPKEWWLRPKAASKRAHIHSHTDILCVHMQIVGYCKDKTKLKCASVCLSPALRLSSKLIFKNADKEDFGTYSVSVTNTEGVSSSYKISAEGRIYPSLCKCGSAASPPNPTKWTEIQ